MIILILKSILIVLVLADVATSLFAFKLGLIERNPVLRWMVTRLGALPAMVITHGIVVACVAYFELGYLSVGGLIALYLYVVLNNLQQIDKFVSE
jgi:hypothetical protein